MLLNIISRKFWTNLISRKFEQIKSEDADLFLRIFNEYFYKFKYQYLLIFLLIFIAGASATAPLWIIKDVVNGIFVNKESHLVLPLFFLIIFIFVVKGASTYWQTVISSRISNAMVADIQNRLFNHILSQKASFISQLGTDELIVRFNQGALGFQSILTTVLVNGSRDAVTLLFILGTMIYWDAFLTIVSFLVVPFVFYGINILLKKIKKIAKMELTGFTELNKHVRETVQGITVIKSFNLEQPLKHQTTDVITTLQDRKNKIAMLQAAPVPLLDTLGGIAIGFAILYAGSLTVAGTYNSENFIGFALALVLAAEHARRLSQLPVKLKTAMVMVGIVFDTLNSDEQESSSSTILSIPEYNHQQLNGSSTGKPLIQFQDLKFSYEGSTPVLDGFTLDIHHGDMVALVGPSGAGKSTILKLLLKLYEPSSGEIIINGNKQSELDLLSLRNAMSFVGQSNFIFTGSIRDNLTLKNNDYEQSTIEEACKKVGLHEFISQMPEGYNTDVGELGSMISGGQAQRLNMARAIIKDAPILLLDEVTSALDAENEQLIKNYVQSQIGKKTIIVIAHRLSTIMGATQIALINKGKVVDQGPHDQLIQSNDYYEKIVSLQFTQ